MDWQNITQKFPKLQAGWIWLVGAGPGDASLLSLGGLSAIEQAEVIVYDALVHDDIINLAPPKCQLVFAGKRGGKPSPKQQDICERLVDFAKQDKKIVRLKGGDPFIFGRGGEECAYLAQHHVNFRIIPGITAASAAAAYSGISLTHRDYNSSLVFVTGHSLTGDVPDNIDWYALSHQQSSLVFYMAIKHFHYIAERLISHGRDKNDSVAVVCSAAHAHQHNLYGKLCDAEALQAKAKAPAIIIIGKNVDLHHDLGIS